MSRCSEECQKWGKLLMSGGIEGVWELSVISAQFCCEPKTTPKNSLLIKIKTGNKGKTHVAQDY